MNALAVVVNLIVAVLVFAFAVWILGYTPLGEPFKSLLALVLAILVFIGNPFALINRNHPL